MFYSVCVLESAWEQAFREGRRLTVLATVLEEAVTALAKGDLERCIAALDVLAAMGGPLFQFKAPRRLDDAAAWGSILQRLRSAVEESETHNRAMRARLGRHLADPRPWSPAWRRGAARTALLQERHVRRWHATVAVLEACWEATAP